MATTIECTGRIGLDNLRLATLALERRGLTAPSRGTVMRLCVELVAEMAVLEGAEPVGDERARQWVMEHWPRLLDSRKNARSLLTTKHDTTLATLQAASLVAARPGHRSVEVPGYVGEEDVAKAMEVFNALRSGPQPEQEESGDE